MEEKLDLIIQKLDASEYLLNVLGDVTGDVLMQGFTGSR